MKKTLLAAAIAAAVAAPAANAGVIVYGKVHASIDYINAEGTDYTYEGGKRRASDFDEKGWYVSSRASRLGFKGTEDLGNGLSLIWKYETGVNLSDSPSSGGIFQGARNSYIGLSDDWGTFLYGRHDTPMKISTGRLDLFSDQLGDYNWSAGPNNALLGPGFHDVRADNAIAYISPNWNGFTFAGAIVPGEGSDADGDNNNGIADSYSLAGMYSNNGLYLAAAYENLATTEKDDTGTWGGIGKLSPSLSPLSADIDEFDEPLTKWRIGIGYTMNAFTAGFVYENQKSDDMDMDDDYFGGPEKYNADIWQISGAYDFGNNRVKIGYGENKADLDYHWGEDRKVEGKSKHWSVGLDHKLSKRTKAYLVYAEAKADDIEEQISNDGSNSREATSWDGGKESGFSMGLIHTF